MIIVQEILVSDDVVEQQFMCNLSACKGACCWEGDFGAPLEDSELKILDKIYSKVKPYLTSEGKAAIKEQGKYSFFEEPQEYGTTLLENSGACAYLTYSDEGIALCGIEQAYNDGVIDFIKPISCQLYPIRVEKDERTGFEALNYDRWDICSAACSKGKEKEMPVYKFVQKAIIRKYGQDFYDELDAAAQHIKK